MDPARGRSRVVAPPARRHAALWLLLLTCAAAAVATAAAVSTEDFYANLVATPSKLARSVDKQGMIPQARWDTDFDFKPFHAWVINTSVYGRPVTRNYPMSYPCGVWVNHLYKFIFIRNRKAASTTVTAQFGKCHYEKATRELCMENFDSGWLKKHGDPDPAKIWADYFVFSTSRNPWARAGSSFDYCPTNWRETKGMCTPPTFEEYCRDPSVLGKLSNLFHCYGAVGMYHDFYHTEPVAPCLTTAAGLPAIDFLIRYERLTEDLQEAISIINSRRDPKLAAIPDPTIYWKKKGDAIKSHEQAGVNASMAALVGHGEKYRKCGMQCVADIGDYFKADFELFGIDVPTEEEG